MVDQLELRGTKVSRNKIVAVGLLTCLLFVVLFRSTSKSQTSGLTSVCDGYAPPASLPTAIVGNSAVEVRALPLPIVDLKVVVAHDPFRSRPCIEPTLMSSDDAVDAQSGSGIPEKRESNVVQAAIEQAEIPITAIVTGGNRAAALIGEQLYYENDVLENGWQIVAIKTSSILVVNVQN